MTIGGSIFLIVVGAILAFAVEFQVAGIDIHLIGYILMAAGILGLIIGIALLTRRRSVVSTTRSAVDPATGERVSRRATEDDGPVL
jgi:hypothetical protein